MAYGTYSVVLADTAVTTARTLVQINAPATAAVEVLRAWVGQTESETATQEEIQLLRVTTAGTGTSSTPRPFGGYAAASGTATVDHTAEGTAGDSLIREAVNVLNGWEWRPTDPEGRDRIFLPPSGRIALKLPEAPEASLNITAGVVFAELG